VSTLSVLDHTGDTRIEWDRRNRDEVAAAREMFAKMKDKRYLAYRLDADGSQGEVIREFDPTAERIIMSPQPVGG
jgi:hypothetical protein